MSTARGSSKALQTIPLRGRLFAWAENKRLKVRLTDLLREKNTAGLVRVARSSTHRSIGASYCSSHTNESEKSN
jgi:hypothetical protein